MLKDEVISSPIKLNVEILPAVLAAKKNVRLVQTLGFPAAFEASIYWDTKLKNSIKKPLDVESAPSAGPEQTSSSRLIQFDPIVVDQMLPFCLPCWPNLGTYGE